MDNGYASIHFDRGRLARKMIQNSLEDRKLPNGYDHKFRIFSDMIVQTSRIRFEANSFFPVLDRDYPGSYFIFNNRDAEDWVKSRADNWVNRYGCSIVELEQQVLNTRDPEQVVDLWRTEKLRFEDGIRTYFRTHPRFLEIDILDADLPQKVSGFTTIELDAKHWKHHKTRIIGPARI